MYLNEGGKWSGPAALADSPQHRKSAFPAKRKGKVMETKSVSLSVRGSRATKSRSRMLAVLLAGSIVAVRPHQADCAPVVNGLMVTTVDTPVQYKASGPVNTSDAWSSVNPAPAVDGPWYAVPGLAPAPAGGAHWEFSVRHSAEAFREKEVRNAKLHLKGTHVRPPHAGEGPNNLPEISTEAITIDVGKTAKVSTWGGLQHPGADPPHHDFYGIVGDKMRYSVLGATATLGGKVDVYAHHSDSKTVPEFYKNWRIGSSLVSSGLKGIPGGSTVSFDANTGMLTFAPGPIDVLDLQGGLSHSTDPRYAGDAMLGGQLSISPLMLQGVELDGRYRFSGGALSVSTPLNEVNLHASFDEYLIGDTSQQVALDSFGVLSRGNTSELLDDGNETPTFLSDFVDDHQLRQLPTSGGHSERVMNWSFMTHPGLDLATMTNGFTNSALYVPADIYLGGGGYDVPTTIPGDYNGDRHVDVRDYMVWSADFGRPNGAADGNDNGIVDAADYAIWREHLGDGMSLLNLGHQATSAIAVPEPSITVLTFLGLCLTISGRRVRWAAGSQVNDHNRNTLEDSRRFAR